MWHIDTTVIRLLDGIRADLHAVIDNFSRRILAWRVADTFSPVNSVTVLLDASQAVAPSDSTPVVLSDAGVENVNAQVDALIETGVLRRLLAFTELTFSNSMIEAWTVPSIGPITATAFVAALDDVSRFTGAGHVTSFLGLVPREYSSGERQYLRSTHPQVQSLLVQAAWRLSRSSSPDRSASCETCPSLNAAA